MSYYVNNCGDFMTKGNSTSVIAIRLPDAAVARIKTMARRRRQTVNAMLKKVILGYVVGQYYSEEQVAELCESEPLAWRIAPRTIGTIREGGKDDSRAVVSRGSPSAATSFPIVGRNDACPCGSGKKYKKCCGA